MVNGPQVAKRLRPSAGGNPWMTILNGDGKELINSEGPRGNVGYPMQPEEIQYFLEMLRVARPTMNAARIDSIRDALSAYAKSRRG